MSETADKRALVDRDGPVIRKSIGPPVSRPPRTMEITECGGVGELWLVALLMAILTLVMQ